MARIEFGVKTGQGGYTFDELRRVWTAADELGYESAWLYDHFYTLGDKAQQCLEAWTTLSALTTFTRRLKVGTMVTCVNYRQPSLLAKMGATVDAISQGRLILGMGAGWYEEEYKAYGYAFPSQGERIGQLKEALIVIRKLWTEETSNFQGRFYSLQNAICQPKPIQKPHPKMLVGINRGRKTLPYIAAKYADGFNVTSSSFDDCKEVIGAAKQAAGKLGKKQMIVSWQGFILIGRTENDLEARISTVARRRGLSNSDFRKTAVDRGFIIGQPDECVRRLREFAAIGVETFVLGFTGDTEVTPLEIFRDEVAPKLR